MENKKTVPIKWKSVAYYGLIVFFAAVFLFSGIYVISYATQSSQANSEYNEYDAMLESIRAELGTNASVPTDPDNQDPDNQDTNNKVILPEYAPFYALNSDFVGWINIPGTKVNYPVLQSPVNRPDYYLNRTFAHKVSDWGAIYAREVCSIFKPSDNITIYGHHMKDGSMFSAIDKYRKQSFWEEHRTFTFDTLYEHHTYEVFAAFRTSGEAGVGYPYHLFVNAADQAEYDQFVAAVKAMSFYDTGITPVYGEKLLTLSTCEYTIDDGRLVVVARRIS